MTRPEVAVGIDGSSTAERAMLWAAAEASRRAAKLLVVHAGDVGSGAAADTSTDYGRALMFDAEATVYESDATCEVTTLIIDEDAAQVLIRLSERAELVVVGSHGLGRGMSALLGSVAFRVAAHACCPVAIVPAAWRGDHGTSPGGEPAERPVVVGVSATPAGYRALSYAFAEAARRGAGVRAVRSWHRSDWKPEMPEALYETGDRFEARQAEHATLILRPLREAYPALDVDIVVTGAPIDDALLAASRDSDLLVVGCRFADGHQFSRLGPTTSRLLHEARCPVVAVGHDGDDGTADAEPAGTNEAAGTNQPMLG